MKTRKGEARHVETARFAPKVELLDRLGLVERQICYIEVGIAGGRDAVFCPFELSLADSGARPIALVIAVIGVTALMPDDQLEGLLETRSVAVSLPSSAVQRQSRHVD